jgi:aspartate aminotransferase-like enzyme/GNAT superfamily N-acetyltransferase
MYNPALRDRARSPRAMSDVVKIATEPWEFEAIHRLNHHTFVHEIPQHRAQASGRLIDTFHAENTYVVCVRDDQLLGMVAVRGTRPFSLDRKVPDLDTYLPPERRVCELRLLAVDQRYRTGRVLHLLLGGLWRYCREQGYQVAIISAATRQLRLYRHIGFRPFAAAVGTEQARFQPMILDIDPEITGHPLFTSPSQFEPVVDRLNLLPGPVPVQEHVRHAFDEEPDSHRSPAFVADLARTRSGLCRITGARYAEILLGSGTLANDVIAGQLSLLSGRGLILSNGEFGERLADHAARFDLPHDLIAARWGEPFDIDAVRKQVSRARPAWIWFTVLETSTGVLNDPEAIAAIGQAAGARVCVDAVSAFGTIDIALGDACYASAVSGKGAGAFAGLAIVFYNHEVEPSARLPRYLDLGLYARSDGVPFTHSSNLLRALGASIDSVDWKQRFERLRNTSAWLRMELRGAGFALVAPESHAAPGVVTIALPEALRSADVAHRLEQAGYGAASRSAYLRQRNWIQVSLMADPPIDRLRGFVRSLCHACAPASVSAT